MSKQRYKYWQRDDLYKLMKVQALNLGYSLADLHTIVYSEEWDPARDFNGCNFIQDDLHPFLPCFIHDYGYIVYGGGNKHDLEFKNNLIKSGFSTFRAWSFYIGVRLGWAFYYKWKLS